MTDVAFLNSPSGLKFAKEFTDSGVKSYPRIKEVTELRQNHQNPFNPETHIPFYLPTDAWVELEIYNAAGRLVRTLVNGPLAAGPHSILWDGRESNGLPGASGIYLYRLRMGLEVQTLKMLLLK